MAAKSTGLLTKGVRNNFFERFTNTPRFYPDLTTRIDSDTDREIYKWLGSPPRMRELGTGILPQGLRSESYSIDNMEYEASIEVDRSEKLNDRTGQIMMRAQELGVAAAIAPDKHCADLLKAGSDADALAFDGVPFFDASHVSGDSGAQSNELSFDISAVTPAEPNTPTAPSARTLQVAFGEMLAAMMGFKDDRGEPMDIPASGLVVVCHPQQLITWETALNAAIVNNTANVLGKFRAAVVPMARLTATDTHYLLKTDVPVRPLIYQHREDVRLDTLEEGSEHEIKTGKLLYVARAHFRVAYGKWYYAIKQQLV